MLYYHFGSKRALYSCVLREAFAAAAARLQATVARDAPVDQLLDELTMAMHELLTERAYLPAIMIREIAEGATHLDRETLTALAEVPRTIGGFVHREVSAGRLRPIHPLAAYLQSSPRCHHVSCCCRAPPRAGGRSSRTSEIADAGDVRARTTAQHPPRARALPETQAMRPLLQTPRSVEIFLLAALAGLSVAACQEAAPSDRLRVSGQVEATNVQVSSAVAGRIIAIDTAEGQRVSQDATIVRLDTADATLGLLRAQAERAQAEAQLRLVMAGPRGENVRQAEAAVASANANVPPPLAPISPPPTPMSCASRVWSMRTPDRASSATTP